MTDINITYYNANDLVMAEYNPRQLTKDQYTQLRDSINRFGLVDPLIVNKNKDRKNILVGGHQRLRIAKEIGLESIPCVEIDLSYDQEKELNIRLNKNVGEWDYDALANHFDVGELTEWGFSNDELQFYEDEPTAGLIDDDEIPEVEEPITQAGDLWILGEHRLLCGDATKKEDVDILMDGKKADMVFTDPPYGMDLDTDYSKLKGTKKSPNAKGYKWNKIIGDDKEFNFSTCFKLVEYVKEQFWWGADYYFNQLPKNGSLFVWQKRDKADHKMIGNDFEICWSKKKHKKATFWKRWVGFDSIEHGYKRLHPTQKPIDLIIWFFEKYEGEKVLDMFLGSGSTLIACEKTNRKCYGMEIDPHYCDVIVKRWEEFSGKKAERVERAES